MNRLRLLTLDDFSNIYINNFVDAFDYDELKRRHALRNGYYVSGEVINTEVRPHRGATTSLALQSDFGSEE